MFRCCLSRYSRNTLRGGLDQPCLAPYPRGPELSLKQRKPRSLPTLQKKPRQRSQVACPELQSWSVLCWDSYPESPNQQAAPPLCSHPSAKASQRSQGASLAGPGWALSVSQGRGHRNTPAPSAAGSQYVRERSGGQKLTSVGGLHDLNLPPRPCPSMILQHSEAFVVGSVPPKMPLIKSLKPVNMLHPMAKGSLQMELRLGALKRGRYSGLSLRAQYNHVNH